MRTVLSLVVLLLVAMTTHPAVATSLRRRTRPGPPGRTSHPPNALDYHRRVELPDKEREQSINDARAVVLHGRPICFRLALTEMPQDLPLDLQDAIVKRALLLVKRDLKAEAFGDARDLLGWALDLLPHRSELRAVGDDLDHRARSLFQLAYSHMRSAPALAEAGMAQVARMAGINTELHHRALQVRAVIQAQEKERVLAIRAAPWRRRPSRSVQPFVR